MSRKVPGSAASGQGLIHTGHLGSGADEVSKRWVDGWIVKVLRMGESVEMEMEGHFEIWSGAQRGP